MPNPGADTKPSGVNRKTLMGSDQSVKSHMHVTDIRISVIIIRIQAWSVCFSPLSASPSMMNYPYKVSDSSPSLLSILANSSFLNELDIASGKIKGGKSF